MHDVPPVEVTENTEGRRFEARIDGELAGIVDYQPHPDGITALHTEVFDRFEGQGVGGALVGGMFDRLRRVGRLVEPVCPFVAAYLERHPDERDIVTGPGPDRAVASDRR